MNKEAKPNGRLSSRDPPHVQCHPEAQSKGMEKIYQPNQKKKAGVAIFRQNIFYKEKKKDEEGHYIMVKGLIQQDLTILNIYAPNTEAPRFIKQAFRDLQ